MVRVRPLAIIVVLIIIDIASPFLQNATVNEVDNELKNVETRRKRKNKKEMSTSSSSTERKGDVSSGDSAESLSLSSMESSTSTEDEGAKNAKPKSSNERRGWRKWHRKCTPCPEDMKKKWRDRSINWICGAYQRARRSFKSLCMMHYRNCQDGTMFVKIHDHRCEDDTGDSKPHGDHFFYEYRVAISDDPDTDNTGSESTSEEGVDTHEDNWRRADNPATMFKSMTQWNRTT